MRKRVQGFKKCVLASVKNCKHVYMDIIFREGKGKTEREKE